MLPSYRPSQRLAYDSVLEWMPSFRRRYLQTMNMGRLCRALILLAAVASLAGCVTARDASDGQFQRQVKRAQECRQMQDRLVAGQPLTPERVDEITEEMSAAGCSTRL
jgi:siroheme synthase